MDDDTDIVFFVYATISATIRARFLSENLL